MDRIERISEDFTTHFLDLGAVPDELTREEWNELSEDPGNTRRRLGVSAPIQGEGWIARFCPQIIADQSAFLDDLMFLHYLNALLFVIDREVTVQPLDGKMDAAMRIQLADDHLMRTADDSLNLLSQVEFAAFDG